MAGKTMNKEQLAAFAAAYADGAAPENGDAVAAYLSGLGKKTVQTVSETPELLLFMADNGMIPGGLLD